MDKADQQQEQEDRAEEKRQAELKASKDEQTEVERLKDLKRFEFLLPKTPMNARETDVFILGIKKGMRYCIELNNTITTSLGRILGDEA